MYELIFTMLVMFFAAMVQGVTGFGFGLIAVGLLSLMSPIRDAAVMSVIPALMVNGALVWQLRRHLCWADLRPIAVTAACFTPLGVVLLNKLDASVINGLLAVILLVTLLQSVLLRRQHCPWHRLWLGLPMGMLSGVLAGAYGSGGPPLVAFVHSQHYDRFRHVVSIQVLLGIAGLIRVICLIHTNILTAQQWTLNALGVFVVLPGIWLGLKLLKYLPQSVLRAMVLLLLGLIMIHAALRAMR